MKLEKPHLFSNKSDIFILTSLLLFILFYSLLIEYNNYRYLTEFDSTIVDVTVVKQYKKSKIIKTKERNYQVLKLQSRRGYSFYTTKGVTFETALGKKVKLEIWAGDITFYEYLNGFFAFSKTLHVEKNSTFKLDISRAIDSQHCDKNCSKIYKALYIATPLDKSLQHIFSNFGISHLVAISGFHLGVLSTILFFIFKMPYKFLQNRYFTYRSYRVDSSIFISLTLLSYLLFLESPPSLLRAFVMLIVGFIFYDRGIKIVSMWNLLFTMVIIISISPAIVFSLGFWLSIAGVFYIFLALTYLKEQSKKAQFFIIPFWVYILMFPYSIVIFSNFSIYHPASILLTSLFTLFYPLSIALHIIGLGELMDAGLLWLLNLDSGGIKIELGYGWLQFYIFLSLLSLWRLRFLVASIIYSIALLIYSLTHIF